MAADDRIVRGLSMVAALAVWLFAAASASAQSPAALAFVQEPSNAPSGGTISPAVTVAIENSFGVVVTPDTSSVTLSIAPGSTGSGTLGGTLTVAAVNGVATFSNLSISAAGTYMLQATDVDGAVTLTPATSTAFTISVQVKVAFAQQPAGAQAGGAIAPPVIVDVEDGSGNVVTSDHSNVTMAIGPGSSGPGTLGGTLTVAAVNGVATFSNLTVSAAGGYTLEASDGVLAPATSSSFTVTAVQPNQPPTISDAVPGPGAISVGRAAPIELYLTSAGLGVDLTTVVITASRDGGATSEPICTGLTPGATSYDATANAVFKGTTYIGGSAAEYVFVFEPAAPFDYEETVTISVAASDLAGNPMSLPVLNAVGAQIDPYQFTIATRSFGFDTVRVDGGAVENSFPTAATYAADDSVWVAWERDDVNGIGTIFLAKQTDDHTNFGSEIQVTTVAVNGDCHKPVIAITATGTIFIAYEEHESNTIGVLRATTAAPTTWTQVGPVSSATESVALQKTPAVTVDSTDKLYVAAVGPDINGVEQIGVGTLVSGGTIWTVTQVTNQLSNQSSPAIAHDANDLIYAVWINTGNNDLYGADSSAWTTLHQVVNTGNASSPAIATEASGTVLHFVWVATITGVTNTDILHAQTAGGWTGLPLTGASVLDTGGKGAPAAGAPKVVVTGSAASGDAKVFVMWQDNRSKFAGDTDIEFAETNFTGAFGTNILVSVVPAGAGLLTDAPQSNPALAVTTDGAPYAAWTDLRQANASHIFFDEATEARLSGPLPLPVQILPVGGTATFNDPTNPHFTQVVITALPGAFAVPRNIVAYELRNPAVEAPGGLGFFPDGSGLYLEITGGSDEVLSNFVTVTVTLAPGAKLPASLAVYRLVPPAGALGSSTWTPDLIQNVSYNPATRTLVFQAMHLTGFAVGSAAGSGSSGGGGSGGGCAMAPAGEPDTLILLLPLAALGFGIGTRLIRRGRPAKV
jgi:hypothetical protein